MKRTGRDRDGRVIILSPTTADEHIAVQREPKARTTLLQSIPDDHVADFHYIDDARDIWNAVKARFGGNAESKKMRKSMMKQEFLEFRISEAEGLHKGYDMMQKILSQLNQLKAKPEDEDINLKFLRALPSSWSHVALTLKTKGGLELLSFDDLYYKLKTLEIDPEQQLAYEDFKQIEKLDLEEMDLKWKMAMLSVRVHKFEQKARRKIDFDKKESASDGVIASKEFGMIDGYDTEDAIKERAAKIYNLINRADTEEASTTGDAGEFVLMGITSEVHNYSFGCENKYNELHKKYNELNEQNGEYFIQVQAYKNSLKTLEKQKRVLQRNQLALEHKIRVLSIELENTYNLLKHSERINVDVETAKKDLQIKLDNHLIQTEKWRNSSKNLFRLIESSMSVRTKIGLGFNNCIRENELGWDDSAFSVFTTNSEDVEGRTLFHRFVKADSMKVVPLPLSGDYTSLSYHSDLDESQMSYGTKSSTSSDSKYVSNDFVSCDDSDKSSEVNTNDFASSDSSVKSSEPKPDDSTSCASTSSVSISEHEAEIESNAGHFRKNASSVSKLCFVCGSATHLIKDCDFNEKQMANKTVGIGLGPVHCRNKVNHQNQFVPQAVLLRTGKTYTPYVPTMSYNHMKYGGDRWATAVKPSAGCSWKSHGKDAEVEGIFDSGCSRSMTGNKERLDDFQVIQGEKVTFGGGEGRITGKGIIRTPMLDFENVYYVKELQQFNLFSISQICDKNNQVLFTDTEYLVLSKDFKLPDDSMVVLRVPRKHNIYTINLNNLCPRGNFACLVAHASVDESVKWHRRMGHVNYKNVNRLVKGNLVRGLPPKLFKNDHTHVASCKGKQHKASYKAINTVSSIFEPLQLLHMDLFGPTPIRSIDYKYYCLVITDDYSRCCWVFFLEHKDVTYPILKDFINLVENQLNKKVKAIRCDNGIEFKNVYMIELCEPKGIKREYNNARTLQQNGVAERKNRTLIEAARTMLADSKLPTMFWTEAVRTACYVLNRVLVTSPHNKIPYALLTGNIPSVSHFKPFGCHVTILNTSDHLGKFDGKADEGYIIGYSATNQSARTQGATTNPAGTQDVDSDSNCDEQVIIVPSYPLHSIQGTQPKDTSGDEVDDSLLNSADEIFQKELARLKGQEQKATSNAESLGLGFANDDEELQKNASAKTVPTGSIPVPTGYIPVPAGAITVSTDDVPVHTSSSTDSFFDDEPTTRFPYNVASTVEILKNKRDAMGIVVRNKARLVAQGHRQEEGIDYDEVFAPEAIRLFLAFASYMEFMVYRMDVKSAFLYERIGEEVYVTQPRGFVDPQHLKKVYKVVKALYGLHQAPRAWYETLSTFLLKHGYRRGTIDKTLFFKKNNRDIILVQVYVDDIIFGSTKKAWCDEFEALMKGEFQMSAMG
uniref:Putative ribonuclease H-like domain-containing protein n=1 Tax=Tanacetum cinerariifolium TaxID=118510 RepID=A0A6L2JN60_TANCI|nr:putative ribonuclease H-like domain-containing protein [Tanacetum cinerariifolium]